MVVLIHLNGVDNVEPLVKWAKENPDKVPSDGIPCKDVIISYQARLIWYVSAVHVVGACKSLFCVFAATQFQRFPFTDALLGPKT